MEEWVKANSFNVRTPDFTISELPENAEFEFRVAAITSAGVGDYSLATPPIKIKERIGMIIINCPYLSWLHHQYTLYLKSIARTLPTHVYTGTPTIELFFQT